MASASKSIPFAVPAQPSPQVNEAQAGVQSALEAGASVELGPFRASLKRTERRSVAWKQVCARELGERYCDRVLAATRPDTFTHLVVTA